MNEATPQTVETQSRDVIATTQAQTTEAQTSTPPTQAQEAALAQIGRLSLGVRLAERQLTASQRDVEAGRVGQGATAEAERAVHRARVAWNYAIDEFELRHRLASMEQDVNAATEAKATDDGAWRSER